MYTKKLLNAKGGEPHTNELYQLWVLADRLLIPKLQNDTIIELLLKPEAKTPIAGDVWIYTNTTQDSKPRRFLADRCAMDMDEAVWSDGKGKPTPN
jgi:hypothetical protein